MSVLDRTALRAGIILAVGFLFALAVTRQWNLLAGNFEPTSWIWTWRDLGILKTAALCLPPFLLICWVLWRDERAVPLKLWTALALLVLSNYLLQLLSTLADPRGIGLVQQIVNSPVATSYFTDAAAIQRPLEWLSHFQDQNLGLHSVTHPPGPILFYYAFFKLFGVKSGAFIGGCVVGLLASLGVAMMYAFTGLWTNDRRARLTSSAFYAILPAITLFFPEFDQVYPILSMLLILCGVNALNARAFAKDAACTGAAFFAATFFAYNLLTCGIFLLYFGLYYLQSGKWSRSAWERLLQVSATACGVCVGLYLALWLATGYDPLATFQHALVSQAKMQTRPYLPFPLWDPYDFFVGTGITALPLLVFYLKRLWDESRSGQSDSQRQAALTVVALATILTVDLSGLLRGESTRVWLFLQPLVVAPVAIELSRFPLNWRLAIFSVQWWILVCLRARMSFINP